MKPQQQNQTIKKPKNNQIAMITEYLLARYFSANNERLFTRKIIPVDILETYLF
jgi:hypothetical protein